MKKYTDNQDCLVLIDDALFSKFIEILNKNLPNTLRPYLFLLLQNKWKRIVGVDKNEISPRCTYNTYVLHDGDPKYCTFVALSAEVTQFQFELSKYINIYLSITAMSMHFCLYIGQVWYGTLSVFSIYATN